MHVWHRDLASHNLGLTGAVKILVLEMILEPDFSGVPSFQPTFPSN